MRRGLCLLAVLALSGCLTESPNGDLDGGGSPAAVPYHVDETFELFPAGMDETWEWTMTRGMTGRVTVEFVPDPVAANDDALCYDLRWPQGQMSRCASGGIVISVEGGSVTTPHTVLDVGLLPNDFTLHIWTGSSMNHPADARVRIDTYAAPE